MRVGIYIRVSTDEQAREGFSIEAQRRVLNAWAAIKGAESVVEYVDDGYSAKNLKRPAVQRLIDDCRRRKLDTLIVWRLDRLTRDLRDMLMLMDDVFNQYDVEFVSSTESVDTSTPTGRLFLNILGAFAQNERESNADRVKMVMKELSKGCKHLGGRPPYGYSVNADGFYEIVPHEADAIRMIFAMKGNGDSYARIITALEASGYKTRSGSPWSKTALYEMLRNEKYTGVYIYGRAAPARRDGKRNNHASKPEEEITRIPGGIPAIITYDQWRKVRDMSKEGKVLGGKNHAKNVYVLSGLVRCGVCGQTMVISNAGRNRDGSYWRAYRCKNKCVKGIEYRKLEACIFDFLSEYVSTPEFGEQLLSIVRQFNTWALEDSQEETDALRQQLSQVQRERNNLFKLASMADDDVPKSLLEEIRRKDADISTLEHKIAAADGSHKCINEEEIIKYYSSIHEIVNLKKEDQKQIAKEIIESITIFEDRIGISLATNGIGGAEPIPAVLVAFFSFAVSKRFFKLHNFPSRYYLS